MDTERMCIAINNLPTRHKSPARLKLLALHYDEAVDRFRVMDSVSLGLPFGSSWPLDSSFDVRQALAVHALGEAVAVAARANQLRVFLVSADSLFSTAFDYPSDDWRDADTGPPENPYVEVKAIAFVADDAAAAPGVLLAVLTTHPQAEVQLLHATMQGIQLLCRFDPAPAECTGPTHLIGWHGREGRRPSAA